MSSVYYSLAHKMHHHLNDWLTRKQNRPQLSILKERASRFKFSHATGPRGQYAMVYLRGEPATEFSFSSVAEWPDPNGDYSLAVLDGILDELFAVDMGHVPSRVKFTLERIEWNDVDSSSIAFYQAARGAVREILGSDQFPGNIDYNELSNG